MERKELFKKTTDVLFDAYFNGTLEHGKCSCCAVGNICKASGADGIAERYTYIDPVDRSIRVKSWANQFNGWASIFRADSSGNNWIESWNYQGLAKEVIDATGYTWRELSRIEYAFETAPKGKSDEDWMYNGLVAVLDVLQDIHEATDEDLLPEKTRFTNHYQKI